MTKGGLIIRVTMFALAALVGMAGCTRRSEPTPAAAERAPEVPAPASERAPSASAATATTAGEAEAVLHIDGMVCEGCAEAARGCLHDLDGVTHVDVSFQAGTARVRYDPGRVTTEALASAIQAVDRGAAPPFRVTSIDGQP